MAADSATVTGIIRKLGNGFIFNMIGTVCNQGTTFMFSLVLANLIGKKAFGEYSMTIGTLSTVALLTQLACGITNTRYVSEFRTVDKARTGRILTLTLLLTGVTGLLASAGMLVASNYIALHVVNNGNLSRTLAYGSFYILSASLTSCLLGALAGLGNYRRVARAGVISGAVYILICLLLTRLNGLDGAVTGVFLSSIIQTGILFLEFAKECGRQEIRLTLEGVKSELRIITAFMVPAAVSSYIASPAAWGASAFLARQPGGYEELALYSAANNIRLLALFIPNIVNTVSMSLLYNVKGQRREYRWTYAINVSAMVLLSLAVALPVVLCGRSALGMFGSVFTDGYPVLVILMISTLPESLGIALFQHIQAENRMWLSLVTITVPQSIILAGLASVLVTGYGARGLAMAYCVSWLIAAVTIMLLVKVIGRRPAVAVPVPD